MEQNNELRYQYIILQAEQVNGTYEIEKLTTSLNKAEENLRETQHRLEEIEYYRRLLAGRLQDNNKLIARMRKALEIAGVKWDE
jgi:hypothetical protein